MARRNDHTREELRELAIQAVFDMVDAEEHINVTARGVANAMGYTVGTLYLVFRNLDELMQQARQALLHDLYADMVAAAQVSVGPQAAILELARCYLSLLEQYPGRWRLVSWGQETMNEEQGLDSVVEDMFALVEEQLARLAPARNNKEIAIAARALWSAVHGICIVNGNSRLKRRIHYDARSLTRTLIHTYLSGFMFDNIEPLAPGH